jgi:CubicO group peptidase (beta-lactamase class C family)/D-alanyl-D-alanine dipeptidase
MQLFHKRTATGLLFCLTLLCAEVRTNGQVATGPREDYNEVAVKLGNLIQHELADKQLPALSIALVDDQEIVWAKGFGFADPDRRVPATAETVYRVGSVSKLFTDIAVMQMVERGELDLDVPITRYLPEWKLQTPSGTSITLRQLMSHRAGLLREPPVGHYFDPTPPNLAETVHSLENTELVYAPGERTKYSNAGIATVGYVLERKAKLPFANFVRDSVLEPMGLHSSAFEETPEVRRNLARAYIWTYQGRTIDAPTFQLGIAPAGSMYSTVLDLGKFISILLSQGRNKSAQVISPASLEAMWTPQFAKAGETSGFGLGFRVSRFQGHRMVGHGGAIYGFATELEILPEDKLGVVAVTTMDSANAVVTHIAHEALRMALAMRDHQSIEPAIVTQPISSDLVRKIAGRYGNGDDAVDLIEQQGELFLQPVQGDSRVRLRQLDQDLMVDDKLAYGPRIRLTKEGIVIGSKELKRVAATKPAPPPATWMGLIGEYGWDHDILYILERDGKLTSLIEWYEYEPLEQISENAFQYPQRGLYDGERLVFTRDSNGVASEVRVGAVVFKRRPVGPATGSVFRIKPLHPISELRKAALKQHPPEEAGPFRQTDLVDVTQLDPTIKLDIRYATSNNFLGTPVYQSAKAFLQRPAANALVRANQKLKAFGYGLLIHDAYRPWYVTKVFWDATPEDKKIFVADPKEGSRHNRGCAVDLTLYSLQTGQPAEMVGVYDEMSDRSYSSYPGGTSLQRWQQELLRNEMESEDFHIYNYEWWHFDYADWKLYPIMNHTFEELTQGAAIGRTQEQEVHH